MDLIIRKRIKRKSQGGFPLDEFVRANRIFSSLSMRTFDITSLYAYVSNSLQRKKRVGSSSTFFRSIAKQKLKPIKVLKLYHVMSTNKVEIKIGIRRDEKIRFAQTNSSSGNPP